jgi:hypothetical protein
MPSQARLGYNLRNIVSTSSQARMGHLTMTDQIVVHHIEDLPVEDHRTMGLLATESPLAIEGPLATTSSI